jgi:hypothetical protein
MHRSVSNIENIFHNLDLESPWAWGLWPGKQNHRLQGSKPRCMLLIIRDIDLALKGHFHSCKSCTVYRKLVLRKHS